jgi:membrane protein implicated in regulation of membrane protease activity
VTDLTSDQVVDRCRTYWLGSGVDSDAASDMAIELRSHLQDAMAEGKTIESVIGPNLDAFAGDWASAYGADTAQAAVTPPSLPRTDSRKGTWGLWGGALGIVLLVALVAALAPKDPDTFDQDLWTTVWIVAAAVLALGELLTAGFFLLPFAVAAGAAGVLALIGVGVPAQIITFVVVSIAFLYLLQQFARKDIHGELLPVGAARYIGASALVTGPVDRLSGSGRVMMGTEDWRATTDKDEVIEVGSEVRVIEVRGARLVVEKVNR